MKYTNKATTNATTTTPEIAIPMIAPVGKTFSLLSSGALLLFSSSPSPPSPSPLLGRTLEVTPES